MSQQRYSFGAQFYATVNLLAQEILTADNAKEYVYIYKNKLLSRADGLMIACTQLIGVAASMSLHQRGGANVCQSGVQLPPVPPRVSDEVGLEAMQLCAAFLSQHR